MYFDIMIAFSLREPPLCDWSLNPYAAAIESANAVDPIFGLAGSMWTSLYKLADIYARKARHEIVATEAQDLTLKLLSDSRQYSKRPSESTITEESYESLSQIATAHRYSALLVIHTDILADEASTSSDFVHSLYESALNALLRASVLSSEVMLTTLWPLHTVGMRATSTGDRLVVRKIFEKVKATHSMNCVNFAMEEVRRCWEVGDRHELVRNQILFA